VGPCTPGTGGVLYPRDWWGPVLQGLAGPCTPGTGGDLYCWRLCQGGPDWRVGARAGLGRRRRRRPAPAGVFRALGCPGGAGGFFPARTVIFRRWRLFSGAGGCFPSRACRSLRAAADRAHGRARARARTHAHARTYEDSYARARAHTHTHTHTAPGIPRPRPAPLCMRPSGRRALPTPALMGGGFLLKSKLYFETLRDCKRF
jgi:hypothetical protein